MTDLQWQEVARIQRLETQRLRQGINATVRRLREARGNVRYDPTYDLQALLEGADITDF
jgi:hypothetical protein